MITVEDIRRTLQELNVCQINFEVFRCTLRAQRLCADHRDLLMIWLSLLQVVDGSIRRLVLSSLSVMAASGARVNRQIVEVLRASELSLLMVLFLLLRFLLHQHHLRRLICVNAAQAALGSAQVTIADGKSSILDVERETRVGVPPLQQPALSLRPNIQRAVTIESVEIVLLHIQCQTRVGAASLQQILLHRHDPMTRLTSEITIRPSDIQMRPVNIAQAVVAAAQSPR